MTRTKRARLLERMPPVMETMEAVTDRSSGPQVELAVLTSDSQPLSDVPLVDMTVRDLQGVWDREREDKRLYTMENFKTGSTDNPKQPL